LVFLATKRARVSDDAAEQLRQLVADWGLTPGDRLPPERELASRLGVGRTSVREGLRALEIIGFVEVVPSKGVYLKGGADAPLDGLIRAWLAEHRGTLLDLIELREALETQAAHLAADRASAADLRALADALIRMRAALAPEDPDAFVAADTAFHDAVARASGNALFRRALASIARETATYKLTTGRLGPGYLARALADHEAVHAALVAGDAPAARRAMRAHIVQTPVDLGLLGEGGDGGRDGGHDRRPAVE
jgi:GntR family transcriptional repressor for pyruvate dehydrogenase complex